MSFDRAADFVLSELRAGLDVVGLANDGDLFEVVLAVDEMKFAPSVDVERAENGVAGALAGGPEECFGFVEEQIKIS